MAVQSLERLQCIADASVLVGSAVGPMVPTFGKLEIADDHYEDGDFLGRCAE
jgi:hypothetical protein